MDYFGRLLLLLLLLHCPDARRETQLGPLGRKSVLPIHVVHQGGDVHRLGLLGHGRSEASRLSSCKASLYEVMCAEQSEILVLLEECGFLSCLQIFDRILEFTHFKSI